VADEAQSVIREQVEMGVAVRMAVPVTVAQLASGIKIMMSPAANNRITQAYLNASIVAPLGFEWAGRHIVEDGWILAVSPKGDKGRLALAL
jgi:hypothetical protein